MGYVLPYGQMSLWGATVITNLMSAIPWIGQDIVESTYAIEYLYTNLTYLEFNLNSNLEKLPVLGNVNPKAHPNRETRLTNQEYSSLPKSFLAFLVGFIDGDGYIQITKTEKGYINIKLVISLHLDDISVLNYIHSVLKLGIVNSYYDKRNPCCKLVINKTDLQEILFPLLMYNNITFLTETRLNQFSKAIYVMSNNIKIYSDIPETITSEFKQPENAIEYTQLSFFRNWIVGFTMAEGSFFIKSNNDGCYQLKQRIHIELFNAFLSVFQTERKITIDKEKYMQFGVSSKRDIQTVINFFSFSGLHPLIGLKHIQYEKWLNNLNNSFRYKNLKFPN